MDGERVRGEKEGKGEEGRREGEEDATGSSCV